MFFFAKTAGFFKKFLKQTLENINSLETTFSKKAYAQSRLTLNANISFRKTLNAKIFLI